MKPKISFVVVARNDNYCGDFTQRMQLFTDVLSSLCIKHQLKAELVVVEWNPPDDKDRLRKVIRWETHDYFQVRIIEVPYQIHKTFAHSDRVPLYEFIGKNVGIRRAKGNYILATNPDIIFSEELIEWMARNLLEYRTYYRATRYDVDSPIPPFNSLQGVLGYCHSHVVKINTYEDSDKSLGFYFDKLLWKLKHPMYDRPFTNASGDFLLMDRKCWHDLAGYLELIGADSHGRFLIDGMILFTALHRGFREVRLNDPLRIYHMEHERQSGIMPYSNKVEKQYSVLEHGGKDIKRNGDNWGLGTIELPEVIIDG